jgi:hypothetical protein
MNWKLLLVLALATCSFACDKEIREVRTSTVNSMTAK